ncbi:MAG: MarR family winged helix-turn-helix transcriptional regulator [Desulfovibrio sp.]|uniref:MarR family winged helix-turn-helix transcriptional regulator n=1 Tax=Desulfovibrio sp. 7SRBS1 TaxID=3378064 RepID=UPI003B425B2C
MAVDDDKRGHPTGAALHDLFREVFHLQAILAEAMDAVHEQSGMRTSHKRVAEVVDRQKTATVPDVAAELNVSRQFVQTVCNELNAQGLLEFKTNPRHKRSKLAELTDTGRTALYTSREQENKIIEELLPGLDAAAIGQAAALLRRLRERMEGHPS